MKIRNEDQQIELPPGFRFHPTNEELITHYLSRKVVNSEFNAIATAEADLNKCEPWDLPFEAQFRDPTEDGRHWDKTLIDGRTISVSRAKYPKPKGVNELLLGLNRQRAFTQSGIWKPKLVNGKETPKTVKVYRKVSNDISYKDALLSKLHAGIVSVDILDYTSVIIQENTNGGISTDISIQAVNYDWMKSCMVGIIKTSYEEDLVQKSISQDGIEAKIVK
ncbi:NAC domain-containing protein 12-like [Hibiscus syriacus]|uniref:NAC domain-containing protein 12-like n=1 Tax=Hibiscus syriacus TaxID=106335 RepID=UPI00192071F3|nr:NAC domain-containing protein 12-like [Hibiscus syriacus]